MNATINENILRLTTTLIQYPEMLSYWKISNYLIFDEDNISFRVETIFYSGLIIIKYSEEEQFPVHSIPFCHF